MIRVSRCIRERPRRRDAERRLRIGLAARLGMDAMKRAMDQGIKVKVVADTTAATEAIRKLRLS